MKTYYKAIILVLASENLPIYKFFKKVFESYMENNQNVKVFFVYGSGTTFERKNYDLVYDDVLETVMPPHPTTKVINAFEYIVENFNFDFLIRTNLSTFWDLDKLLLRLETLPKINCLSGRLGYFHPPRYVVGTGMIISKDLIHKIIINKSLVNIKYPKYIAEDKLLSLFFTQNCNVEIIQADSKIYNIEKMTENHTDDDIINEIEKGILLGVDHFRVKNLHNRELIDVSVMKKLCEKIYNIDISKLTI